MSVTLKRLNGAAIPEELRRPDQDLAFKVVGSEGDEYIFASEEEAAAKVVELNELDKSQLN